jgi:hypothetical protein
MTGSATISSTCNVCGPFSQRRSYDVPVMVDEGLSWTLGTATIDERVCDQCGRVAERRIHTYFPEK